MPQPGSRARLPSPQTRAAVDAARALLEEAGPAGLTMRRLGARLGIRAQSVYEHFPNKAALETALCIELLWECGDRTLAATEHAADPLVALCDAHRAWALQHPHLYRLCWCGELDRTSPDVTAAETYSAAALIAAVEGDRRVSRAIFAFTHGVISLELEKRLPRETDADALYRFGIDAVRGGGARPAAA